MDVRDLIHIDPEVLEGQSGFRGTRFPVETLFDLLGAGDSVDGLLEQFPTVSKEQAIVYQISQDKSTIQNLW